MYACAYSYVPALSLYFSINRGHRISRIEAHAQLISWSRRVAYLSVSLCLFSVLYWRVCSLFFSPFLSFLSISLSSLSGPTTVSERFALCNMATQAITRKRLNAYEQNISRNGLTFHEDILANGHADLQSNGRVQVRSLPVTRLF